MSDSFPFLHSSLFEVSWAPIRKAWDDAIQNKISFQDWLVACARGRNRWFDAYFYNVTPADAKAIDDFGKVPQGSIIRVVPKSQVTAKVKPITIYPDAVEFFEDHNDDIGAISVSGVGSSSLGAAGFARDVAEATGEKVAAVVSSYGADDLVYEGIGGFYFLRGSDQWELFLKNALGMPAKTLPSSMCTLERMDSIGGGPDILTLKSLLRNSGKDYRLKNLRWVVGHSKGNMAISSAIRELQMEEAKAKPLDLGDVRVVLFSALTALSQICDDVKLKQVKQFIGVPDPLGWTNSWIWAEHEKEYAQTHHLNRQIPFNLLAGPKLKELADEDRAHAPEAPVAKPRIAKAGSTR